MGRMIRRQTARVFVVLTFLVGLLVAASPPARACFCAPPKPIGEAIEHSEWVFVGRQIGQREISEAGAGGSYGPVRLEIEVLAVYKGDVPDKVELRTGRGVGDCGVSFASGREVGFTVNPDGNGLAGVSSCGGAVRADELRMYFEPLPARVGTGPPGFLVGVDIGPYRVAVLDTAGELLTYAEGEGRLAAAAACPQGRKIVEIVEPVGTWVHVGGSNPPTLEVRDTATLSIESTQTIDIESRNRSQLNGMGWIFDLQCHDPEARLITYLLPNGVYDNWRGSNLPGPATLHVWRDGDLSEVEAGEARAVAVDAATGRFYAVTGIKGQTLETRDLAAGQLVDTQKLPERHVGWLLALSPDRSALAVLGRESPMEKINWYYAEVNRLLVIDLTTGEYTSHRLLHEGFARLVEPRGDTYVVAVSIRELPAAEVSQLVDGTMELIGKAQGEDSIQGPIAVGPDAIVSGRPSRDHEPIRLDVATGERVPIEGLVDIRLAITLPPGTQITNLPPLAPTTTTTMLEATIPPTSEAPSGQTDTTVSGTTQAQASAQPDHDDPNGWPWGITIGLIVIGATAATLTSVRLARPRRASRSD